MKKSKSNPWMKSKALYVIPVAALALSAFATPKFVAPIEETVTKLEGKGTENSANLQALEGEKEKIKDEGTSGTTMMRVRGHDNAQPLFVLDGKIIEVSKDVNFETMNSEEQFSSLLNINVEDIESITVLKNEEATKIWGDKGANGVIVIATKKETKEPERQNLVYNKETGTYDPVLKDLVKKLPGAEMDDEGNITVGGKPVSKIMLEDKTIFNNNDTIYNVPAVRAQYPGGDLEIFKFLSENIRYPKLCHEFGVQGRVIVSFVIEKNGSISSIKKNRAPSQTLTEVTVQAYKKEHPDSQEQLEAGQDLGDLLFEEAKRVLELMPKWEPAKDEDGNPVRSIFNLPVMFRLQ